MLNKKSFNYIIDKLNKGETDEVHEAFIQDGWNISISAKEVKACKKGCKLITLRIIQDGKPIIIHKCVGHNCD